MIRGKTRFKKGKAPSQLDQIYLNQPDKLMRTWNDNTTGYDHNMVGARVKSTGKIFRAETFSYRNIDAITEEQFSEVWDEGQPADIFEESDPSAALELWEHKVHRAIEILAPLKTLTTKANYNPWFTRELREPCDERDLRRKEAGLWKTREAVNRYKKIRNQVNNRLKSAQFE